MGVDVLFHEAQANHILLPMKEIMIKKLLNYVFLFSSTKHYTREEHFLGKSNDHYDLDYRIKYLDINNYKIPK